MFNINRENRWLLYSGAIVALAIVMLLVMYSTGVFSVFLRQRQFVSKISGYVYEDINGNKFVDPGEPGVFNVTVTLHDASGVLAEYSSDVEGYYSFNVTEAGQYTVVEEDPPNWYSTTPNEMEVPVEQGFAQLVFVDFGDKQYNATIYGVVFDDANFNGIKDLGEGGVAGAEVDLFRDGESVDSSTTDPDGFLSFVVYQPGDYTVVETDLGGWDSTTANEFSLLIDTISGQEYEVLFGDTQEERSLVSCVVFNDTDGSGFKDDGEVGIPGVSVELRGSEGLVATGTTDIDGVCEITLPDLGGYTVNELVPEGWFNTTGIEVDVSAEALFGEIHSVEFGNTLGAYIRGYVFFDASADGEKDLGEILLRGVNVSLYRDGALVVANQTDVDGKFSYLVLEPGEYVVNETDPAEYFSTTPNLVNVSVDVLAGQGYNVTFGETRFSGPPRPDDADWTYIYGIVFNDEDNSESWNTGEPGISGVTVNLYDEGGKKARKTTVSDSGYYFKIDELGSYKVEAITPDGWSNTTSTRVVVEVDDLSDMYLVNFGVSDEVPPDTEPGEIYGFVFDDVDGDSLFDPGESGIENVSVGLYQGGEEIALFATGSDGSYLFEELQPGDYKVVEEVPGGWYNTTPSSHNVTVLSDQMHKVDFGCNLGATIKVTVLNGRTNKGIKNVEVSLWDGTKKLAEGTTDDNGIHYFTITKTDNYTVKDIDPFYGTTSSKEVAVDVLAGQQISVTFTHTPIIIVVKGSISGFVFNNETESGIDGVTVTLYKGEIKVNKITKDGGKFSFSDLSSGGYTVDVSDPEGYILSTGNDPKNIILGSGQDYSYKIGYYPLPPEFGSIAGSVFNDTDGDGVWDEGELGFPDLTVGLYNGSGLVETDTTDSEGDFSFTGLMAGDYEVNVTDPVGYTLTKGPDPVDVSLAAGEDVDDLLFGYHLPVIEAKGDVVFIFDTSGSMMWAFDEGLQAKAIDIMNSVRAAIPDTAFGVGSFVDYPGTYDSYGYMGTYGAASDYPFKMDLDITLNTGYVSDAVNALEKGQGEDKPEDHSRVLYETLGYNWREGATRIVVLFADSPPHSAPSGQTLMKPWALAEKLFSSAYGGDPGPDGIMLTCDDLDYGPVVQMVSDNGITIICVDCQSRYDLPVYIDAHNNLKYMADMTGGTVHLYTSSTVADDIIDEID
jgi:uncharacterized protein (DUF2141 family)